MRVALLSFCCLLLVSYSPGGEFLTNFRLEGG
jgi:hypothetical protein